MEHIIRAARVPAHIGVAEAQFGPWTIRRLPAEGCPYEVGFADYCLLHRMTEATLHLPPGECCMPGLHFPSECHTAADYERQHGVDWRKTPNARLSRDQQP